MTPTFFIKTYGCAQNTADSQRIKTFFYQKGHREAKDWKQADTIVINTCIIRESAENRAYGFLENVHQHRLKYKTDQKIILTGCLVGSAIYQKNKTGISGLKTLKKKFPQVNQFLPIDNISFSLAPLRDKKLSALIPISSGCNNFCSYCIVPLARGKEISRPFKKILSEAQRAIREGFDHLTLVGQNVNSYGSDLVKKKNYYLLPSGQTVQPILVKSMGKFRIPTLFPYLLDTVAQLPGLKMLSFVSSNPWDFSDALINVIKKNTVIDRHLHLPVQSGDDQILKLMNRNYTSQEYLHLVKKIKKSIPDIKISTDLIIGFPQEDELAFQNTIKLCKKVNFTKAYLNKYSPRSGTVSYQRYPQTVSQKEKRHRWHLLDQLINKVNT